MDAEEQSARWQRYRVAMTRALRPLAVALPLALIVVSLGFLVNRVFDGGWVNFAAIAFVAAALFIALGALVRLWEAHRAQGGDDWLSRRDSVLVGALIVSGVVWLIGAMGITVLAGQDVAAIIIPNFIYGMFGVCITLGMLLASARRALKS